MKDGDKFVFEGEEWTLYVHPTDASDTRFGASESLPNVWVYSETDDGPLFSGSSNEALNDAYFSTGNMRPAFVPWLEAFLAKQPAAATVQPEPAIQPEATRLRDERPRADLALDIYRRLAVPTILNALADAHSRDGGGLAPPEEYVADALGKAKRYADLAARIFEELDK